MGAGVSCEVFDGTLPPGTRHYLIEERFNPGTNQKTYAREFGTTSELRQTGTMTKEKALEWDAKAYDSRKTFHAFLTETLTDALMKKVQNREPIEVRKLFNPTQLRVGAAKSKRDCDAAQEKSDQAFESAAGERDAGRTTQTTLMGMRHIRESMALVARKAHVEATIMDGWADDLEAEYAHKKEAFPDQVILANETHVASDAAAYDKLWDETSRAASSRFLIKIQGLNEVFEREVDDFAEDEAPFAPLMQRFGQCPAEFIMATRDATMIKKSKLRGSWVVPSDVFELFVEANEVFPIFQNACRILATKTDVAMDSVVLQCKHMKRAIRKAVHSYDKQFGRLLDLVRGSLVFDGPEELLEGFRALTQDEQMQDIIQVVRVRNALTVDGDVANVTRNGHYRAISLAVRVRNPTKGRTGAGTEFAPHICELQLHLRSFWDKRRELHVPQDGTSGYERYVAFREARGWAEEPGNAYPSAPC
jgi:hypothetical protein